MGPPSFDGSNTHLRRFHKDPTPHLTGYGVFHGDDRQPIGEPLPTGSLRRGWGGGSLTSTGPSDSSSAGAHHQFGGGPPAAYTILPTMSLRSLQQRASTAPLSGTNSGLSATGPSATTGITAARTSTLASNRSVGLNLTAYEYSTGTYYSTSGLPPTVYKAWSTEYVDEYRGPKARRENLEALTMVHGTQDALRSTRYQFQGYPHAFKSYAPSSMTERGQVMPNYGSRVNAF